MLPLARIYRACLIGILVLFFFNSLLDRLLIWKTGIAGFTALFYLLIGIAVVLRIGTLIWTGRAPPLTWAALGLLSFVLILGAVYGDLRASVFAIKEVFFGLVFLFLFAGQPIPLRLLLWCMAGVLSYAIFQGLYFLTQGLTLPPWDALFIKQLIQTQGALNLWQGDLIRPFATFGSFVEYQITAHVLVVCIFAARRMLRRGEARLAAVLLVLLAIQNIILTDRTPILMALIILLVVWAGTWIVHAGVTRSWRLAAGIPLLVALIAAPVAMAPVLLRSNNPGVKRLGESAQFWRSETVKERQEVQWALAQRTIAWNPEGAGPAEIAIGSNPHAQRPHNNLYLFQIGYSYLFPVVFLGFVALTFGSLYMSALSGDPMRARLGFVALGLMASYLAASFFDTPFSGYGGPVFFLVMLWLRNAAEA